MFYPNRWKPPFGGLVHDVLVHAGHLADRHERGLQHLAPHSLVHPLLDGRRPADGKRVEASDSPLWSEHVTFNEYFDGDTGEGLGACHQTGWTALVAVLLCGWPNTRHGRG